MDKISPIDKEWLVPRDAWDKLSIPEKTAMLKAAVSEGIYDLNVIRQKYNEFAEGGSVEVEEEVNTNQFKEGGGIHIKPSHRGRLTELKARTGKSEAELYNDGNPAHKKMVVFARNARKWHAEGGNLFDEAGQLQIGKPYYSYDSNGQLIKTENGEPIINYNITLPDVEVIGTNRNYILKAEQERKKQKTIAKQYLTSVPSISNIMKGLEALYNSSPFVTTASTVNPHVITGMAPTEATPIGNPLNSTTSNFLKWIGKPLDKTRRVKLPEEYIQRITSMSREQRAELMAQERMLKEAGIDMSKIDAGDILDAYDKRMALLSENLPERYTLVRPIGSNGYSLFDNVVESNGIRTVGKTDIYGDADNSFHIGYIQNLTRFDKNKIGGVQERGLNSAINVAKSKGMEGVISGEQYQNAPLQLHVIEKFTDRIPLYGRGYYSNVKAVQDYKKANNIKPSLFEEERYVDTVEEMMKASPDVNTYLTDPNAPAFLLKDGSMAVPTKSILFNPQTINNEGQMIIDWNNPYIFKKGGQLKN